jgi:hypothetical protein
VVGKKRWITMEGMTRFFVDQNLLLAGGFLVVLALVSIAERWQRN